MDNYLSSFYLLYLSIAIIAYIRSFCDEPSFALDKENETEIISLLHELSKDKIGVVISHSQNIIETAENQLFL